MYYDKEKKIVFIKLYLDNMLALIKYFVSLIYVHFLRNMLFILPAVVI